MNTKMYLATRGGGEDVGFWRQYIEKGKRSLTRDFWIHESVSPRPLGTLLGPVPRRLFFTAQQWIAIAQSPKYIKERALIPEKEIRRTWPSCHVSLEISSKNHKPLEKWAKPNLSPDVTPRPANFYGEYFRRICHVVEPDPPELFAVFSRHSGLAK